MGDWIQLKYRVYIEKKLKKEMSGDKSLRVLGGMPRGLDFILWLV